MKEFKMLAKTLFGLEDVLAKELIELGANNVQIFVVQFLLLEIWN